MDNMLALIQALLGGVVCAFVGLAIVLLAYDSPDD
jgi:hypothetical protein